MYVFVKGMEESALAYIAYPLSAYALAIVAGGMPEAVRRIKTAAMKRQLVSRLVKDRDFRYKIGLGFGLVVSAFFALFKLLAGRHFRSYWLICVGVYYLVLTCLRLGLFKALRQDGLDFAEEKRIARNTGWLMLLLNAVMSSIVLQMVRDNRSYRYPGVIIYAIAAYAFYKISVALWRVVRRGWESPVMGALRRLKLTEAMMSVLALQTALLARFGEDPLLHQIFNAFSGAIVCAGVLVLSVQTIRSRR